MRGRHLVRYYSLRLTHNAGHKLYNMVLSPMQRLDEVLKIMYPPNNEVAKTFNRYQIKDKLEESKGRLKITNEEVTAISNQLSQIIDKLEDDGYIYYDKDVFKKDVELRGDDAMKNYMITFEGELFNLDGGYVTHAEKEKLRKRIQNLKDYLLIVGSCGAAIGTIGLLVWEIYKTFFLECSSL
jgi:hypothetical protein